MLVHKCVPKFSAADCSSSGRAGYIKIEIPCEQNGCAPVVSPCIVEHFVQLGTAQRIIGFAFQMQVVGDYRFARNIDLADQRQASSEPFLKWGNIGKEPMWPPEIRLLLESDDPGI